jgi:hypothetical protein
MRVPIHLPKINPANSETGMPKPPMSTQQIVESKNNIVIKDKLACFKLKK